MQSIQQAFPFRQLENDVETRIRDAIFQMTAWVQKDLEGEVNINAQARNLVQTILQLPEDKRRHKIEEFISQDFVIGNQKEKENYLKLIEINIKIYEAINLLKELQLANADQEILMQQFDQMKLADEKGMLDAKGVRAHMKSARVFLKEFDQIIRQPTPLIEPSQTSSSSDVNREQVSAAEVNNNQNTRPANAENKGESDNQLASALEQSVEDSEEEVERDTANTLLEEAHRIADETLAELENENAKNAAIRLADQTIAESNQAQQNRNNFATDFLPSLPRPSLFARNSLFTSSSANSTAENPLQQQIVSQTEDYLTSQYRQINEIIKKNPEVNRAFEPYLPKDKKHRSGLHNQAVVYFVEDIATDEKGRFDHIKKIDNLGNRAKACHATQDFRGNVITAKDRTAQAFGEQLDAFAKKCRSFVGTLVNKLVSSIGLLLQKASSQKSKLQHRK